LRKRRSTGCCRGGANGEDEILIPHRRYGVVDDARLLVLVVDQNCCSMLQFVAVFGIVLQCVAVYCSVMQCDAVCCSVLQCVAVCCSVLQCDAV